MGVEGLSCSFCGKSQMEVGKLLAGPNVYICEKCIELAEVLISKEISEELKIILRRPLDVFIREHLDNKPINSVSLEEVISCYRQLREEIMLKHKSAMREVEKGKAEKDKKEKIPILPINEADSEKLRLLTKQYGVCSVNLVKFDFNESVVHLVSAEICRRHSLIPLIVEGSTLVVAIADPRNLSAVDDVKFITGYSVELVVASRLQIDATIKHFYPKT